MYTRREQLTGEYPFLFFTILSPFRNPVRGSPYTKFRKVNALIKALKY